jgi:hypothetical protein
MKKPEGPEAAIQSPGGDSRFGRRLKSQINKGA